MTDKEAILHLVRNRKYLKVNPFDGKQMLLKRWVNDLVGKLIDLDTAVWERERSKWNTTYARNEFYKTLDCGLNKLNTKRLRQWNWIPIIPA